MKEYTVYEPHEYFGFVRSGTVTAASVYDALRIAKQKGSFCPAVGLK